MLLLSLILLVIHVNGDCPVNSRPENGNCIACSEGYVSDGLQDCTPCNPGTYASRGRCDPCPVGTHGPTSALESCIVCAPGMVARQVGLQVCSSCPPGYRSIGTTECDLCPSGHVVTRNGTCSPCPAGTSLNSESTECINCPAGTYSPFPGGAECIVCEPGKYNPNIGSFKCRNCALGFYSYVNDTTSCHRCPSGETTLTPGGPCVSERISSLPCDRLPDPELIFAVSMIFVAAVIVSTLVGVYHSRSSKV